MNVDRKLRVPNAMFGILATTLACGLVGCADDDEVRPSTIAAVNRHEHHPMPRRYEYDGPLVQRPRIISANAVSLDDSAGVIGVSVKGHDRAYRLSGMKRRKRHVVNDVVEGVPVTVTYCDLTECVRAFTKAGEPDEPLAVRARGFDNQQGLLLEIDGEVVPQEARKVPLDRLEFELTSWGAWRAAHPDTDICIGE